MSELEVVDGPNILMVDSNLTVKELILDYIMEIDELKTDLAMKDEYIIKLKKQLDNMAKNPIVQVEVIDDEEWALVAYEACNKLVRFDEEMMEQFIFERKYRTVPYIQGNASSYSQFHDGMQLMHKKICKLT